MGSDGSGGTTRRLLLRSHLSPCIADFQRLYPDASLVGILRDPVDVLRSFAGLSTEAVLAATGVDMLADVSSSASASPWPPLFLEILSDMMQKEVDLYGSKQDKKGGNWDGRCHYITFPEFKANPVQALEILYEKIDLPMSKQFELEDLRIKKDGYLNLPSVKRYSELVGRSQ